MNGKRLLPKVKKCTMCAPRQAKGQQPACTEVCPVQAGIFGERDDLLQEAEKRLREEPSKYFQHIYGKEEVGGTSVLYLSAVPFEQLGLPANLPRDPMPLLTYRVLSKIPTWSPWAECFSAGSGGLPTAAKRWRRRRSKETGDRCQVPVVSCQVVQS